MELYISEFLLIATIHFFAVASPGPDFALIIKQSIKYGRRTSCVTSFGIGTGILVHVFYSLLGLSAVIASDPIIYNYLQYIAASYFIFLGVQSLRAKNNHYAFQASTELISISPLKAFMNGFLINGLNLKVTFFFISLFTLVIDSNTPVIIKSLYGLYMAFATILWFIVLSFLLTQTSIRKLLFRHGHLIERVMGVLLLIVAIQILQFNL